MALLANRVLYRLSAVWWTAVYAGLCRPNTAHRTDAPAALIVERPGTGAAENLIAA